MKNLKRYKTITGTLLLAAMLVASCKKSFDGKVEDPSLNRSFMPSNVSVSTAKDSAKVKWNAQIYATKGMKYTVDFSTDSLFAKVDYTTVVDTLAAVVIEPAIKLNTPYFTRVKVNAQNSKAESAYAYATRSFKLTGQQFLKVIRDFEITSSSVLIHWSVNASTAGVSSVVFTPTDGGTAITTNITAADAIAGQKLVTGLNPATKYTVQLLADTKSKGIISVTTAANITYTQTLSPTDNLATAIANAADGAVIGLSPGTYNLSGIASVAQKSITIRSTSNDPTNTKVLAREFDLVGTGAGLTLAGIEFNGNYSGTSYGVQFIALYGTQATTGAAATFGNVRIDNCIIHDFTRCIFRGNYGTNPNDQKITSVTVNNSQFYNIDQTNLGGYYMFSMEKLQLNVFAITKSTFYSVGEGMINMSTVLPTSNTPPTIQIDYCTFNNVGGNGKYLLMDANSNNVNFSCTNNIIANAPINTTIQSTLLRSTGAASLNSFWYNDHFKLFNAPGGTALALTGLGIINDNTIDLGWTAATTNFLLTPTSANAALFTGSANGTTIGDPRWAY